MKQQQSAHKQAEDALLRRPLPVPVVAPRAPHTSGWLAQPYHGVEMEIRVTDNMSDCVSGLRPPQGETETARPCKEELP